MEIEEGGKPKRTGSAARCEDFESAGFRGPAAGRLLRFHGGFASRSMAGPRFFDRPVKKGEPRSRNSHHTAAVDLDHRYESAVICLFPNRESRT